MIISTLSKDLSASTTDNDFIFDITSLKSMLSACLVDVLLIFILHSTVLEHIYICTNRKVSVTLTLHFGSTGIIF